MTFREFFKMATGHAPYDYQRRLACGERNGRSEAEWLAGGADCSSHLISIPTGLGKTAAVVLAWLWNRLAPTLNPLPRQNEATAGQPSTANQTWPRRLVYCLPMRTLVEQTRDEVLVWLGRLALVAAPEDSDAWLRVRNALIQLPTPMQSMIADFRAAGAFAEDLASAQEDLVWLFEHSPIILMGGEEAGQDWDVWPEKPAILIGTQDMLLSRALNRGYGMSRYRWPMHFGLLNNDALWVLDETQLMGPGLWTSGQLDWMRKHRFGTAQPSATWWMSATNSGAFLDTPDRREQQLCTLPIMEIGDDANARVRLSARRPLSIWKPATATTRPGNRKKSATSVDFQALLVAAIRQEHQQGTLSLVVCNSVKSAQALYRQLKEDGPENAVLLTSRFRRLDRQDNTRQLLEFEESRKANTSRADDDALPGSPGLICVATQVVEAGLDISARRLWAEFAPWPSLLQRLGRLNRDGRADGKAAAFLFEWPPAEKKAKRAAVGPYAVEDVELGHKLADKLAAIYQQSPQLGAYEAVELLAAGSVKEIQLALQPKPEPFPRALDLHGLFSNEPDMFGGFTDISQWVRGEDLNADVTVFWRQFDPKRRPPQSEELEGPAFDSAEGCAVPVHRLRGLLGDAGRALTWDERSETWQSLRVDDLCPGMVVMLPRSAGGYTAKLGWTGERGDSLPEVQPPGPFSPRYDDDPDSQQAGWVLLQTHLGDAQSVAKDITCDLGLDAQTSNAVVTSSAFHDIGKAHPVWRGALPACAAAPNECWAKAPFVFALESAKPGALRASTEAMLSEAGIAHSFLSDGQSASRLLWLTNAKVLNTASNALRSRMVAQASGVRAWMRRFLPRPAPDKPCIRHEAASALALWYRYFRENGAFPGLTIFLAAAHHGKVRTTLYARESGGDDVCGVPRAPAKLPWQSGWPMDFACAADGTAGEFSADGLSFTPASPGWTALVADLLGGWESRSAELQPPLVLRTASEPRHLGPFALAYLEALVCAADVRASKNPSHLRHV